jgi:large subunit ribosomal protein L35
MISDVSGRAIVWGRDQAGEFAGLKQPITQVSRQNTCQPARRALFSALLSMQKTKKSVAKRFKISGTGKLIRRTPGFRHLLAAKSTKSKRRASKDKLVAPGHAKPLKRCLPFGLR